MTLANTVSGEYLRREGPAATDGRSAYKIAMAAGHDAGNRNAQRNGRAAWGEADWDTAKATFAKVMHGLGYAPWPHEDHLADG